MRYSRMIASAAKSYHAAAKALQEADATGMTINDLGQEVPLVLTFPALHVELIAIELFLKSLWIEDDFELPLGHPHAENVSVAISVRVPNPAKGREVSHKLHNSFKRIPDEIRQELVESWSTLENDLKEMHGFFELSRYPYEPAQVNGGSWQRKTANEEVTQWKMADFNAGCVWGVADYLAEFVSQR